MESIKNLFVSVFGAAAGAVMIGFFGLYAIGSLYWLWMAIQISSFWMFVIGLLGPTMFFTGLIGGYSMLFGAPEWIYNTFG
ncbi:MAG: hypothetical protein CMI96_05885 [Pelagibacteraceae bacterium]|nr:hypothetical protein [Pelagibacteraceae bacterium]|tara:strand:- start:241 stop:483 length:243 start_codon:yes stop_codon:yes gene_type:complete